MTGGGVLKVTRPTVLKHLKGTWSTDINNQKLLNALNARTSFFVDRPSDCQGNGCWMLHLVHAFVSSRIDYCNSLLYGVSDGLLRKLQAVQNAAARVVTGTQKFNHITPVLRDLHWLPVCQRIKYKLAMIVYKCLHGLAPIYLDDDCQAISAIASKRHLRSAVTRTLFVPRTTTTLGMRSFVIAGPHIWNSLPAALRTATLSPPAFTQHLKTHLFYCDWQHASENYLGRALQICASSSSLPCLFSASSLVLIDDLHYNY